MTPLHNKAPKALKVRDLARCFADANANERYAIMGRNFTRSNNDGVLIYNMLFCFRFFKFSPCICIRRLNWAVFIPNFHFIFIQRYNQKSRDDALKHQFSMTLTKSICKCHKTWVYVALPFSRKHVQWWWKPLTLEYLVVTKNDRRNLSLKSHYATV